jgi:hypothetical protein
MTREQKYPDTKYFHFHNANPKGRITTDCVIRAISTATELPYNQVVMELAQLQCEIGYDDGDKKLYDKYLQSKGFVKHKQPRKLDGTKYTGKQWCNYLQSQYDYIMSRSPRMVANIGGHHIVAIVDAKVWDIWDSTDGCIGNYWVRRD